MAQPRLILCLGPHRSGTSTVTAALGALGAHLALVDVYANAENAKGFFEQPEVLEFDEALLAELAGAWDVASFDCRAAMAGWAAAAEWQDRAVALVQRLYAGHAVSALKDPRQAVLLPFWLPVLKRAGFGVDCVHVLRDPVEVAASQRARVLENPEYYEIGRKLAEGAALWLAASCQMWDGFAEAGRHVLIGYDRLVDDPVPVLQGLAQRLDLPADPAALTAFQADFIDPALRRSRVTESDRAEVAAALPQVAAAQEILRPLADGHLLRAAEVAPLMRLWRARATQAAVAAILAPVPARLSRRHRDASLAAQALASRLAETERRAQDIADDRLRQAGEHAADRARIVAEFQEQLTGQAHRFQAEQALAAAAFESRIATLQAELGNRDAALAQKAAEVEAMLASTSWRIAAPVRLLGRQARRARALAGRGWIGLNRLARSLHRSIATRSPATAEVLRSVAAPILHRGNRALLRRDYVPAAESLTAPGLDRPAGLMVYQAPRPPDAPPLVTVIVPNYNHAPYLAQRLDSIYAQTYPHFEVILMDDCSQDDSRAILQAYADRYPDKTRLIFNATNSGGAFFQWETGIRAARGELIWVAESDDWCTPNFLETLVPFFANRAVQLAYCPTVFMNRDGTQQTWSMREYLADLGPERWDAAFVLPAPIIVREAFAARNIIPNVSSAVFRRPDRLDVLENDIWRGMRTSGDWVLYLNLIRGGCLAYSPAAQNYFRQHGANTSVGSFTQDRYYAEHAEVARCVQRHYRVDEAVFIRQRQELIAHWIRNRGGLDQAAFDACYDLGAVLAEATKRKPHLLMAGFAFAPGGGETFPIALANLMKTAGYSVTFLDCHQEPEQPGIREQLARDIAIVSNFQDLNGILRDFDIQVIHSHHAWVDNTVLDILPEDSPVRTVITLHGMYETIAEPQLRRMLPRLVRRTAGMVYIADKNTEAMTRLGGMSHDTLVRIDNALPRGVVHPVPRADLGIGPDAFVLTTVSRGIPEKGWDEAIRAVTRARELSGADIRLVIVGNGPEYDRLAPSAPAHVHFAGFRANTRDYFAMADLGLLPSRFRGESFPLVLIDCLNAGRPMLASNLGEVRAMLSTPDGLAGEVFDLADWQVPVEALAERIAALAVTPGLLARMTARVAVACAKFDPDRMRDAYDAVYRAAMARPEAARAAR